MTIENANRLAELRRSHGLSQEELAEKLGVSRQAVSKWERAESSPDTDNLIALARLYGVSLDDLLGLRLPDAAREADPLADAEEITAPDKAEEEPVTEETPVIPPEPVYFPQGDYDPLPDGSYYDHIARQSAEEAARAAEEAERERRRRHYRFPYPIFVTLAYLILGFMFHKWHPGWIIFLTIPLYYLPDSEREPIRLLGNPVMVTIIYLLLGCFCNAWHPGWLVFLLIPLLGSMRR